MKKVAFCCEEAGMNNRWLQGGKANYLSVLKEKFKLINYDMETVDQLDFETVDLFLFYNIPPGNSAAWKTSFHVFERCIKENLVDKMILFISEPPTVIPQNLDVKFYQFFKKIFTWHDQSVDNNKYFKIHYAQHVPENVNLINFNHKKLCTVIAGNKNSSHPLELYSARKEGIRAFERICPYQFDLYGVNWNVPINQLQAANPYLIPYFPSYRGRIEGSKLEVLKHYRFSLCYENMLGVPGINGYITEKIFDCFFANCVPVYLGDTQITNCIPKETFIDQRDFSSYEELYAYLVSMKEKEWLMYIRNIQSYLNSELFKDHFSIEKNVSEFVCNLNIIG